MLICLATIMKRIIAILIILTNSFIIYSQTVIDANNFPTEFPKTELLTSDLLKTLNWDKVVKFCDKNEGYYSHVRPEGFLKEYEYVKQGRVEFLELTSYDGFVLEFIAYIPNVSSSNSYYFDKNLWLRYVDTVLPELSDTFKISINEKSDLLKAYYHLLGVDIRDEYGWICEYSTVGMLPKKREAVIVLIKHNRIDLLKKLMDYPNIQVKLYAIDALIYLNTFDQILSESDWEKIFLFRDSGETVKTCGNSGSYKIYGTPIADLLSKKAVKRIPRYYKSLEKIGYRIKKVANI